MTALLLLALAMASALAWPRSTVAVAGSVLLAAHAGTTFPDVDQFLPLGGHRSALSHSALPLLLACWRREMWPIAAGLGFGIGFHLAADFFPNAMTGYALVKVPLSGALPAWGSWLWLGGHSVMCFWVASWLTYRALSPRLALPTLIGVAAIGTVYLFTTDGGWPALLLMLGSTAVALGQTPRLFRRS